MIPMLNTTAVNSGCIVYCTMHIHLIFKNLLIWLFYEFKHFQKWKLMTFLWFCHTCLLFKVVYYFQYCEDIIFLFVHPDHSTYIGWYLRMRCARQEQSLFFDLFKSFNSIEKGHNWFILSELSFTQKIFKHTIPENSLIFVSDAPLKIKYDNIVRQYAMFLWWPWSKRESVSLPVW